MSQRRVRTAPRVLNEKQLLQAPEETRSTQHLSKHDRWVNQVYTCLLQGDYYNPSRIPSELEHKINKHASDQKRRIHVRYQKEPG